MIFSFQFKGGEDSPPDLSAQSGDLLATTVIAAVAKPACHLIGAARRIRGHRARTQRVDERLGLAQISKLQLRRLKVIAQLLHGVLVDELPGRLGLGVDRRLDVAANMLPYWLFIQYFYWFPNSSDYIFIP